MSVRSRFWLPLSSSTLTVSPVLIVLGVFVAMSNGTFLDPYWLDVSSKATVPVLFLAPGFAALAAWDAARWRTLADAAVRSWLQLLAMTLAYVAVVTAGTFAVTLALLYTQQSPEVGLPRLDVLASGVWVTVGYAALGFGIGRFVPRLVAAPVAFGLVWFWVAYTPAVQPFWLRNVTGNLGTSCCAVDTELVRFALVAPALVALALLLGTSIVLTWGWRPSAWLTAIGVLAASVAFAGSLMSSVGADPVQRRTGAQECVAAAGTQWCAWPEHEDTLAKAAPSLGRAASRLREAGLSVPTRLRESEKSADGWSFSLVSDSPAVWPRVLAGSPLDDLPPPCTNHNGGVWPAGVNYELAVAWLDTVVGTSEQTAAESQGAKLEELRRIRSWSPQRQLAWYSKVSQDMRSCEPPT